ncbi:hypothetical protein CEXT_378611 [Caerostris extrusa]|uniref:Transmembrane protein n=1 Tax=Caerostris extrusa TaxID=172846 RepID=A0AAV4MZB2_CAEEX|nr:hypothetical protein CEXT_378611 [Caerostris extrusa]
MVSLMKNRLLFKYGFVIGGCLGVWLGGAFRKLVSLVMQGCSNGGCRLGISEEEKEVKCVLRLLMIVVKGGGC